MTQRSFQGANRLLDREHFLDFFESETNTGNFPICWKKSFDGGFVIPLKVKICRDCLK